LAAGLVVGGCGGTGCRSAAPPAAADNPPAPGSAQSTAPTQPAEVALSTAQLAQSGIVLQRLQPVEVADPVVLSGRIAFDDMKVSHVVSPVSGRVMKIFAQLGDHVRTGTKLMSLDSPDLGQASADVDRARADLQAATRAFGRQKSLYEQHAAARRDFEAAEDAFSKARAEYERAQQKTSMLHAEPGDVSQTFYLRAPIDGEVVARNVNPGAEIQGQYSGGNPTAELFTVGSLESVYALGNAFEMDLARVHKGDKVDMHVVAYPQRTFSGTVDYVGTSFDPNTRTAQVRCAVANPNGLLKPEMFATLYVYSPSGKQMAVPRRSLFRLGNKTVVFVKTRQTADEVFFVQREVDADENVTGDVLPVHAGVHADETIVAAGGILLTEMF
jgi:cobalt-zinc-cadmium efflux system membrane fusion protein